MTTKRAAVTPLRQSDLESVMELLQLRVDPQSSSSLSGISLSYAVAVCLIYLCAVLGGGKGVAGTYSTPTLALLWLLTAAHSWLAGSLARNWFCSEFRARINLLRPAMLRSLSFSNLLLALADPDFTPGKGWHAQTAEDPNHASLINRHETHLLSRRVLDFLAHPSHYSTVFPRPLPEPKLAEVNGGALVTHMLLGLLVLSAGLVASLFTISGNLCIVIALFCALVLSGVNDAVLSAGAWRMALSVSLAEILAPSQRGRKHRQGRARPRPPAHPPDPDADRPSAPGADSRGPASAAARQGPRRESER